MENQKMTNKKALTYVLTKCELPEDVKSKLSVMLEQLNKKAESNSKADEEKAKQNNELQKLIFETLAENEKLNENGENEGYTVSEIMKLNPALNEYSNQKVTAMINKLKDGGKVEKTMRKGKAYFVPTEAAIEELIAE